MKATIKDTFCIALFGISLLALPFAAHAGQDEHQRYLIRQAIKAKQELKQEAKQQQAIPRVESCGRAGPH